MRTEKFNVAGYSFDGLISYPGGSRTLLQNTPSLQKLENKLWSDGLLSSYADFTFLHTLLLETVTLSNKTATT